MIRVDGGVGAGHAPPFNGLARTQEIVRWGLCDRPVPRLPRAASYAPSSVLEIAYL